MFKLDNTICKTKGKSNQVLMVSCHHKTLQKMGFFLNSFFLWKFTRSTFRAQKFDDFIRENPRASRGFAPGPPPLYIHFIFF